MPEHVKEIRCPFCGEANFFPTDGAPINHSRPCAGDDCDAEWLIYTEVGDFLDDDLFVTHVVPNVGVIDDEANGVHDALHAIFQKKIT